jgi:hypothetical protein
LHAGCDLQSFKDEYDVQKFASYREPLFATALRKCGDAAKHRSEKLILTNGDEQRTAVVQFGAKDVRKPS